MKNIYMLIWSVLSLVLFASFTALNTNIPLDKTDPVKFEGEYIIYQNDTIKLGPKSLFIDGKLTEKEASKYPYVYNTINEAVKNITDGTESEPMTLNIAPWVYWIDNPDDPEVRIPQSGSTPYALILKCEWLRFNGLSQKAENVVVAANRGQTIGAKGNFTLFRISGDGTSSENITFGNYCNIDLDYPLNPDLNRKKRAEAIVQAQLIHCNGDKIVARNTHFISRLNLCPFVGAKRILFDRCHFESTDDALCGTGVHLNSTFEFYGSKPFYNTWMTGAVFLNCDIWSSNSSIQYFTKANGQMAVVDTRIKADNDIYVGWRDVVPHQTKNYQYNVTLNEKPLLISENDPASTIEMKDGALLNAYRFEYNNEVVYNTYNLLRGNDDWDPMGIKEIVQLAEKEKNVKLTNIPTQLLIYPNKGYLETGKDSLQLKSIVNRFGNYEQDDQLVNWSVSAQDSLLVKLLPDQNGEFCTVIPSNKNDETIDVIVTAQTILGLQAASVLTIAPEILEAPKFIERPKVSSEEKGKLHVSYKLDMPFDDESLVKWYRCSDKKGSNPIEVAVSRNNKPLLNYEFSVGDVGYYIMASVSPKHLRCNAGQPKTTIFKKAITTKNVEADKNILQTDFKNVSTKNQPKIIPGFWTFDHLIGDEEMKDQNKDAWYYGDGRGGSANLTGLQQSGRKASMLYTPVDEKHGDMKLTMTVAPFKTAGQGFSVAHLYMDVLIKFDNKSMTGYGLRFIRTTKYGNAVDCYFVKYENGKTERISEPISTNCYRTPCSINIEVRNGKIYANAFNTLNKNKNHIDPAVVREVNIEEPIEINSFGGFGIQYNGGASAMILDMKVEWE